MLLLIDNYDSFVYILKQYFEQAGQKVIVKRNDEITVAEAKKLNPDYIVISPGPATPKESGVSMDLIRAFQGKKPILGVCLGHQCMGELYGGKVIRNPRGVRHGKRSPIIHKGKGVFRGLPSPFMATRYHSLIIEQESFPHDELEITAQTAEGEIMGVRHKKFAVEGVQFHPESYLTEYGMPMIINFLEQHKDAPEQPEAFTFGELIKILSRKQSLNLEQARFAAIQIMEGLATPVQVSAFLSLLASKGETRDEIAGFAKVMREKVFKVYVQPNLTLLDTCGTGGDGKHTLNVSTLASLVAAGAGVLVAKHGNRSVSSQCGSADLLERFGVNLDVSSEKMTQMIDEIGIAFLFAPKLHPAMKFVAPIRKELGIRTIFNLLGPLTNPADTQRQILGVYSADYVYVLAEVLNILGSEQALIVHSEDGLDEISISAPTTYAFVQSGKVTGGIIYPEEVLGKRYDLEALVAHNLEDSYNLAISFLNNKASEAVTAMILINAGAAIWIAGKASSLMEGYQLAQVALTSGKALAKLEAMIRVSNQ